MRPIIPTIAETGSSGERYLDIYSRLLKDRIIFISEEISDETACLVIAEMLFLEYEDSNNDINLYINCPGGSIIAGFAIYDTMQFVCCDVATFCIGRVFSMGAVLLAGGTAGKRHALPHSLMMIHQAGSSHLSAAMADAKIDAAQMNHYSKTIIKTLAQHTGQEYHKLSSDCDHDLYLSAEEAKGYGLIDSVMRKGKS